MMKKFIGGKHIKIRLKKKQREYLKKLISEGKNQARRIRRAQMLLLFDRGRKVKEVAESVGIHFNSVLRVRKRFLTLGLEKALSDEHRPGNSSLLNARQTQRIVALACSPAPDGRSRWTVRLLAEEVVRREVVPRVGRETIRVLLKSHDLKPWRGKNVVHSEPNRRLRDKNGGRS